VPGKIAGENGEKMKRIITLFFCAVLFVFAFASCSKNEIPSYEGVGLIEEESFFDEVEKVDGNICYYCRVTLENRNENVAVVELIGNFPDEKKMGVVTVDFAVGRVEGSETVMLMPNEKRTMDVTFTLPANSSYNGTELKKDRDLPDIGIKQSTYLEDETESINN
jgi:hypothetical protein